MATRNPVETPTVIAESAKPAKARPARKPLAKAVPVAPWPPTSMPGVAAGVAGPAGGPVPASALPAAPVARKAGASVGTQVRAKKLSVKPVGKDVKVGVKAGPKRARSGLPAGDDKQAKVRVRLVRDSFTMPQVDFDLIDMLKKRALGFQHPAKKSELLRAGLQALAALDDAQLGSLLKGLPLLKPGRPKKAG